MSPENTTPTETQTLAQRLAEGRLTVPEALRYGLVLAETLRRLHDAGGSHGALTPRSIVIGAAGMELLPGRAGAITPYTAPETLDGRPAGARSDIFSFGAIFYEMLTGTRAFSGDGAALAAAIATSATPTSGSPLVDRVVTNCLAKDPAARWPRMQKILMELKLLTVAARRTEAPAAARRADGDMAAVRGDMQRLEIRMAARLQTQEQGMAELLRATTGAVEALRSQLAAMDSVISELAQRPAEPGLDVDALEARMTSGLTEAGERLARLEEAAAAGQAKDLEFHKNVAADFHDLESAIKAQDSAIHSARTALSQTDDLVERVVEALESLQSAILDQHEDRPAAAAVN